VLFFATFACFAALRETGLSNLADTGVAGAVNQQDIGLQLIGNLLG
jgi:hypothetical protein